MDAAQNNKFLPLTNYLLKIPGVKPQIYSGFYDNGLWWIKFQIDTALPLSWQVVQELGCVINYLSIEERLPTLFYPVSPAPYLNGGPEDFLSWIIENKDQEFEPIALTEWLEGRLPRPVDDLDNWIID